MGEQGSGAGVDATIGQSGGADTSRISRQQRTDLAAFLIVVSLAFGGATSARAGDIDFDYGISIDNFRKFSSVIGQGIYPSPVEPAAARGLFGFDVGIAVTGVAVDDEAPYWLESVSGDLTTSGYLPFARIVASKGLSFATVSVSYGRAVDGDLESWGGAMDVPVIDEGFVVPNLSLRGSYAILQGQDELDLDTMGVEIFLSKSLGPVTPYGAVGWTRTTGSAVIAPPVGTAAPTFLLDEQINGTRWTAGLRFSLLMRLSVEVTSAEELSYAAKIGFGF